ncbi:hypothetical protein [Streptomyces noursei]|uniref:Small secreted domain n=1 Tax=Streptomyces yunnanensis TaxID=156453 RepID=A0A9X8N6L9_9ACTN|nr:hypothetical protein [Streptomyces noursei]ANZ15190.1 membrane protein [Streptomyces noursei ATCC 11455]MCZ1019139.1 hypothetical protein [Streptomyces noursei]SHN16564.1 hypothetical protein SAMN05216268_12212 [Streptomyces yunnanensis]
MRRALVTLLGAVALTGVLSVPAHAGGLGAGGRGIIGDPLKVASDIGPLHLGRLPLLGH